MLRIIRQFFANRQTSPRPDRALSQPNESLETTVVYVRVKPETKPAIVPGPVSRTAPDSKEVQFASPPVARPAAPPVIAAPPTDRQRNPQRRKSRKAVPSTLLAKLGIYSASEIALLRQIGCRSQRQLQRLTPQRLEKRLAKYLAAQQHCPNARLAPPIDRLRSLVRRGRWAIRFANQFAEMTPRESLLLRAVHRGNRQALSRDSAGMIRRDLQRLALSSRGKRLVTLDQIPDLQRVNGWISAARAARKPKPRDVSSQAALDLVSLSEDPQTDVPMVSR